MGSKLTHEDCTDFILGEEDIAKEIVIDGGTGAILITILTLIYIPIMITIFLWRGRQAVSFKSPYMIIIGGMGFYLHSLAYIIESLRVTEFPIGLCVLSIIKMLAFQYIGYMSLIFRAHRIFKVMRVEKEYIE